MKLADRSPGLLMVLAAVVVYGQILIEIAMINVASYAFMVGALATGAIAALLITKWFHTLLEDADDEVVEVAPEPVVVREPAARPAPRPTALPV